MNRGLFSIVVVGMSAVVVSCGRPAPRVGRKTTPRTKPAKPATPKVEPTPVAAPAKRPVPAPESTPAPKSLWRGETYTGPADAIPARYGKWRSSKMGGGGYIQNVVLCPTNPKRLYSYVDVGGLYRSDDGGQRWRMLHGALPAKKGAYEVRGLVVDPRDEDRIVVALGSHWAKWPGGIFLSADGGDSFTASREMTFAGNGPTRPCGLALVRHPDDFDVLLAGTMGDGIWRSADNGATWATCGASGVDVTDVEYDRADPKRVWACSRSYSGWLNGEKRDLASGFYRSDDGGLTWTKLSDDSPSEILQDPKDAARLYGIVDKKINTSTDGGVTWTRFSDGLSDDTGHGGKYNNEGSYRALASGRDFVLTASTSGTFYKLRCGETTWRKIERAGVEYPYEGAEWFRARQGYGWALGSITVDPRDQDHWFFTDWFAIYQTFDAGEHWKLTIDGIEVTVLHCLAQDRADPGVVHLGMADNGYFISEDGGDRFRNVGSGISNNVKSVSLSPKLPERLYATGPRGHEWEANQAFVSVDRGRSWVRSPMKGLPDMGTHHCNTICVDPREPYTVYLGVSQEVKPGGGGVYKSVDGGASWTWMGKGLEGKGSAFTHSIWGVCPEIAVGPDGVVMCISRGRGQAYRFDAGRMAWARADTGLAGAPNSLRSHPTTAGRFYVASWAGVFTTGDRGASWRKLLDKGPRDVVVDLANPDRLAAGTDVGVMLSTDGGETWRNVDEALPYRPDPIVAFAGDRIVAGTGGSGAFWIPLTDEAAEPVRARPAKKVMPPRRGGAAQGAPMVRNGDMSQGGAKPAHWGSWTGKGTLRLARDVEVYKTGPASLRLESVGGVADGSASQAMGNPRGECFVEGHIRCRGDVGKCIVAVQVFDASGKQIAWLHLAACKPSDTWTKFGKRIALPVATRTANIVLAMGGEGAAWLDEVRVGPVESVFLDQ